MITIKNIEGLEKRKQDTLDEINYIEKDIIKVKNKKLAIKECKDFIKHLEEIIRDYKEIIKRQGGGQQSPCRTEK